MYCDRCGKRIRKSDATEVQDGDIVCLECLQEHYFKCDDCDNWVSQEYMNTTYDGRSVCDDCVESDYSYCDDCNELYPNDLMRTVEDGCKYVCESCLRDNYEQCECCQEYYPSGDMSMTYDGNYVCDTSRLDHYYCCEDCGDYVYEDEVHYNERRDEYFCPHCYKENETILDYHDFDADNFYPLRTGNGDKFDMTFGFELEVSGDENYAEDFLQYFNNEVILMHDGSIKDGGFEIITMPMTTSYFYETFLDKFKKGLQFLTDNGFNSHNYGGLHVHFSHPSIPIIAQLSQLIYRNSDEEMKVWKALTQRREEDLHWCNFDIEPEDFDEILRRNCHDRVTKYHDRYVALNYDDRTETYEFRIFNGNLRPERFLKNFEVVRSLLDYAKKYERATIPFCTLRGYMDFIEENKLFYPNLSAFIEERHIRKPALIRTETRMVANGEPVVYEIPDIQFDDEEIPY